jgi:hypothetical protein
VASGGMLATSASAVVDALHRNSRATIRVITT